MGSVARPPEAGTKALKTSSMGMVARAGKMSSNMSKDGNPRLLGGGLTAPSLPSVRADTVTCVPRRPQSSKARRQQRRLRTEPTASPTQAISLGLVSLPLSLVAATHCALSAKYLLKTAKTCVSRGWSAQVIFDGIRK